jgi:ribonuclease HI
MSEWVYVFTDGACSGNPGPGGWGALIWRGAPQLKSAPKELSRKDLMGLQADSGVQKSLGWVTELGGGQDQTTNNRMEMTAVHEALKFLLESVEINVKKNHIVILSDSKLVILGLTQWVKGWKARGWLTREGKPVSNQDLWQLLVEVYHELLKKHSVECFYIEGHVGHPGNERCDQIAVSFVRSLHTELYDGPFADYPYELQQGVGPILRGEQERKLADPFYLSFVSGELQKHTTWKDCEMRVKGRPGAKFKKITRPGEEIEVLKTWGLD